MVFCGHNSNAKFDLQNSSNMNIHTTCTLQPTVLMGVKDWVQPLLSYQLIKRGCGQLNACTFHLHIIIRGAHGHA